MTRPNTHYSVAQQPAYLNAWARKKARALRQSCRHQGVQVTRPLLCYTGMSGIAFATALALHMEQRDSAFAFSLLYVRKPEEKCHGHPVEEGHRHPQRVLPERIVFVDDFSTHGHTYRRVQEAMTGRGKCITHAIFGPRWDQSSLETVQRFDPYVVAV